MEPRDGPAEALTGSATSRLRMVGYCLVLTAIAFVQQPGRLVGDTKFDLVVDPMSFLARAWRLWDPTAAFGQVQNQAYGYFWPMGPFFSLLHAAALPGWVVQRLWWSTLLCIAFVGVVQVARAMRLGTPGTQVLGGFAFALTPHVLTLLGPTSVEAWPTAWAPWVLLPLVRGAERGSPRRAAALSAVAVAMCGGVNGAAVLAVLPVGAIWLLTRSAGARRRALVLWWPTLVLAGTLWWSVPLLLLGRYSPPFLDYIENAPITTSTTSLPDVLSGTSDWVAYASPADWVAGHLLGTTPLLLVDAAAVAGLGLAGICRRDNPHSRFLFLSVVVGVAIVTFGYTGPVHGWFADLRQTGLDGPLAALRNTHKFDVVLRLPLVLGLAHLVAAVQALPRELGARALRTGVTMAAVAAVAGVAIPAYSGRLAPGAPVQAVPDYWYATGRYLAAHAGAGTALELPAAPFGDYLWGSPHDDILQAVARSPWAVRNIVPLAQPGNVRMLDTITSATEIGRPDPRLAGFLASNGVGYLVVRNDLQPFRSSAPDAVVLHQSLDRSPGLHRVATFGPQVGSGAEVTTAGGRRLLTRRGWSARYPAVEVYRVDPVSSQDTPQVTALVASTVPVVSGDPGSRLATAASSTAGVLAGDAGGRRFGPTYLTDGLARRETAFTAVRQNQSAVMTPDMPWRLRSVEHNHRLYSDQPRWETTLGWTGITGVSASSSQGFADAVPPVDTGESPGAAVDGRRWTEFVSSSRTGATGQWWLLRLRAPASPPAVSITMGTAHGGEVTALRLVTDAGAETVEAPAPGATGTYPLPSGSTGSLEIQAARVKDDRPGTQLALAEVSVPGLAAGRRLTLPKAFAVAPDEIVLGREAHRSPCSTVHGTTVCDDFQGTVSEDASALDRRVTLGNGADYTADLWARLASTRVAADAVAGQLPVQVTSSSRLSVNPAAGPLATVDGNPGSTWVASAVGTPRLHVAWAHPARITRIRLTLGTAAGASAPRRITIVAGGQRRTVTIDPQGRGTFRALRTADLTIVFDAVRTAYSLELGRLVPLPVGVSELRLPGLAAMHATSPDRSLRLPCGSGPWLHVGGVLIRTRVQAPLSALLSDQPFPVAACGSPRAHLDAGPSDLTVTPSSLTVPEQLVLRNTQSVDAPPPRTVPLRVVAWGSERRTVLLGARRATALLVVNENLNSGWRATLRGRALPVQRVDGWKQGWVVPAGPSAQVTLSYTPNLPYQIALLAGAAVAMAVALVAARGSATGRYPPACTASEPGWVDAVVLVSAGALVAGTAGVVVVAVALLAGHDETLEEAAGWLAALLVVASGAMMALLRAGGFHTESTAAQLLACAALGLAVVGANGPTFFRRRNGRSRK